jgi:hypothetical protein
MVKYIYIVGVAISVAMMKKMLFINTGGFGLGLIALCMIPMKVGLSASLPGSPTVLGGRSSEDGRASKL